MTGIPNQRSILERRETESSAVPHDAVLHPGNLYIPSLDGIRAVSFFIVFFAHAGLGATLIPGGFGVTVFFLLSGFLITTLLRAEFERTGKISLKKFYLRRALRILPPLYATLVLAIAVHILTTGGLGIPFAGTLSQALQVANYYEIFASPVVTIPGTGVLWSLAVEEHFYLVFPLMYIWMYPRFTARQQTVILLMLCVAGLAWRMVLHFNFDTAAVRTNYATDTRFDSILFGCVFAIVANPVFNDPLCAWFLRRMRWLVSLAFVVLLGTFLLRDEGFRETWRYTLQGLALVPLFIAAIHYQASPAVRLLNLPAVRFLGVLSYSLYLCHAIIMEGVKAAGLTHPFLSAAISLAGAICFATVVHYWIERPCARIRKRLSGGDCK